MKKILIFLFIFSFTLSVVEAQTPKRVRDFQYEGAPTDQHSFLIDHGDYANYKQIDLLGLRDWFQMYFDGADKLFNFGNDTMHGSLTVTDTLTIGDFFITKRDTTPTLFFNGNIVALGDVVAWGDTTTEIGSLFDNLPLATYSSVGVAKFDSSYFLVDTTGFVSLNIDSLDLLVLDSIYANLPLATGFTPGIASFDTAHFVVDTNGKVTLIGIPVNTDSIPLATGFTPGIASFDTASFVVDEFGEVTFTGITEEYDSIFINWLAGYDTTSILAKDNVFTGKNTFENTVNLNDSVFLGGLFIEKHPTENAFIFNGSIIATEGVLAYGNVGSNIGSVFDNIPLATGFIPGIASFDTASFAVDEFGKVTFTGTSGGIGEELDPVFLAWDKHTGISIFESQISDFGNYEPAFSKNTAFNKNFGTTSGTVSEGHTHPYDNYSYWTFNINGVYGDVITRLDALNFKGGGSTTVTKSATDEITISSTDNNTWRGIDDIAVNGETAESISSNWAYDHAASSTAHPRDTRNQIYAADNLTGTGTIGVIPKYSAAGVLGNSNISQSGSTIVVDDHLTSGSFATGSLTASSSISSGTNITAVGEVTAYSSSDRRLKKNIKPIKNATEFLSKLKPVTFNWNNRAKELNSVKDDRLNYGLIAQSVKKTNPELVHPVYEKYNAIDYEQLISVLIKANQELNERLSKLEKEIQKLKK